LLLVHDQENPEIVADDLERLALLFALVVDDHHTRLLAEGRIGQHEVEPVARIAAQTVIGLDRRLGLGARRADSVQDQVHGRQPRHAIDDLDPAQRVQPYQKCFF
jgi:hypothetical protein